LEAFWLHFIVVNLDNSLVINEMTDKRSLLVDLYAMCIKNTKSVSVKLLSLITGSREPTTKISS